MTADERVTIIGAGQAGLATGYHLQQNGVDFTILADDERVGETWRNRWDSLKLFTPAFFNGLPGLEFPADDPEYLPHKDEVADYLETYVETFDLPVELRTRVSNLRRRDGRYHLNTSGGERTAEQVVVATGAHSSPWYPPFADEITEEIFSCHSSGYKNPNQLREGEALIVGAGNSGTQIATELSNDGRTVWLAGRDTGRIPRRLLGRDIYRWIGPTLLRISRSSFLGQRLYERTADAGDPVFSDTYGRLQAAGVERVPRISVVNDDGYPVSTAGRVFVVPNVIWATGFRSSFPWIDVDVFEPSGEPQHERGVVPEAPGLYFVGLRWQSRLSSSLIGGVGSDAEHIAGRIERALG